MAVRGARGEVVEWLGTSTDIDDQVSAREVLARSGAELEARVAERTAELERALHQLRRVNTLEGATSPMIQPSPGRARNRPGGSSLHSTAS